MNPWSTDYQAGTLTTTPSCRHLALLVGFNLSFLIGALAWLIKITKVALFESVEVFSKDPFLATYFSVFLCLLPSAALYADDLTIWPSSPSVSTAVEATQETDAMA